MISSDAASLVLSVVEFADPDNWTWALAARDRAFGVWHVSLDRTAYHYPTFVNLPQYTEWRRTLLERPLPLSELKSLGQWVGDHVLHGLGKRLAEVGPAMVTLRLPIRSETLISYPFEIAVVDGTTLHQRGLCFQYEVDSGVAVRGVRALSVDTPLRVLAVFSQAELASQLSLRRERHLLFETIRNCVGTDVPLHLDTLHYGATREQVARRLADPPGWDIVHFSTHGLPGALALEGEDGRHDIVGMRGIIDLLQPAAERLQLLVLSSCYSAGAPHHDGARWAGDGGSGASLVTSLARRFDVPVVGMRYPMADIAAQQYTRTFYRQVLGGQADVAFAARAALGSLDELEPAPSAMSGLAPVLVLPASGGRPRVVMHASRTGLTTPQASIPSPGPAPRFVGRGRIMADIEQALGESGASVLCITGMPGVGKTAVAMEAVHDFGPRFEHVVWVDAAGSKSALDDLAIALGLASAGRPSPLTLMEALRSRRVLVVIDGLEPSTDDTDAQLVDLIDTAASREAMGRILVTTRLPFLLTSEAMWRRALYGLTYEESVLLADELPYLGRLGLVFAGPSGPEQADWLPEAIGLCHGHPGILELLDSLAGIPAWRAAWQQARTPRHWDVNVLFRSWVECASKYAPARVSALQSGIAQWVDEIVDRLTADHQHVLNALCVLLPRDCVWPMLDSYVRGIVGCIADTEPSSDVLTLCEQLVACGIVGHARALWASDGLEVSEMPAELQLRGYVVHPAVASRLLSRLDVARIRLARLLMGHLLARVAHALVDGWPAPLETQLARSALGYLILAEEWEQALAMLDFAYDSATPLDDTPTGAEVIAAAIEVCGPFVLKDSVAWWNTLARWEPAAARSLLETLIADYLQDGRPLQALEALRTLLAVLVTQGDHDGALAAACDSTALAEACDMPWLPGLLSAEVDLYALQYRRSDVEVLTKQVALSENVMALLRSETGRSAASEAGEAPSQVLLREIHLRALHLAHISADRLNLWESALAYARQLSLAGDTGGSSRATDAALLQVKPLIQLERRDEARRVLEACRRSYEALGQGDGLGRVAHWQAWFARASDQWDEAARFDRETLLHEYRGTHHERIASTHHNLAFDLRMSGRMTEALHHQLAACLVARGVPSYSELPSAEIALARDLWLADDADRLPDLDKLCEYLRQVDGLDLRARLVQIVDRPEHWTNAIAGLEESTRVAYEQMVTELQAFLKKWEPAVVEVREARDRGQEAIDELDERLAAAASTSGYESAVVAGLRQLLHARQPGQHPSDPRVNAVLVFARDRCSERGSIDLQRGVAAVLSYLQKTNSWVVLRDTGNEDNPQRFTGGPSVEVTLRAVDELYTRAVARLDADDLLEADRMLMTAQELTEQVLGGDHFGLVPVLELRTDVLAEVGDLQGAAACCQQAIAILRREGEPSAAGLVAALTSLGHYRSELREMDAARDALDEAVRLGQDLGDPQSDLLADALAELSFWQRRAGQVHLAAETIRAALDIAERAELPSLASWWAALSDDLRCSGDLPGARQAIDRALAEFSEGSDEDPVSLATALHASGLVWRDLEDYSAAKSAFEQALTVLEEQVGRRDYRYGLVLSNYGTLLIRFGDLDRAMITLAEALQVKEEVVGPQHPECGLTIGNIGIVLLEMGEAQAAAVQIQRSLDVLREALGPEHPEVGRTLGNLGRAHRELGNLRASRLALNDAVRVLTACHGAESPRVRLFADLLADVVREQATGVEPDPTPHLSSTDGDLLVEHGGER